MVVTDLDGTLLTPDWECLEADRQTLWQLGQAGIVRIVATGRSLHSARRVLAADFPVDFLVFSSGAGILDYRSGETLRQHSLARPEVAEIASVLAEHGLDYAVLHAVPDSHVFTPFPTARPHPDFARRRRAYAPFEQPGLPHAACQLLAITDTNENLFAAIRQSLPAFNVVRATSPLDDRAMWLEVYPAAASKATAAEWLRQRLAVPPERTFALGNDYNDDELLAWAAHKAVVANAPETLRQRYPVVRDNTQSGFSDAIRQWLPDHLEPAAAPPSP